MNKKVGFLVGRFQTPDLSHNQIQILYDFLKEDYQAYIIVLGISATKASAENPLDFDSRRRMIEEKFPKKFYFAYIKDEENDFIWSDKLNDLICTKLMAGDNQNLIKVPAEPVIHGVKESVLSKYFGSYETKEIESGALISTDYLKEYVSKKVKDAGSWRAGACWSATNRYPVAYHTVDCAIFDDTSFTKVWMGRKENESKLRFIGGFVDPNDDSAELAAIREAKEETGLKCIISGYISSRKINDWRYKNEVDKIITTFYALQKQQGIPKANDDIKELYKVDILTLDKENVMPIHRELLADVQNWVSKKLNVYPHCGEDENI